MKVMKTLLALSVLSIPFYANAQVELNFHRDLAPIIINGEETGFSLNNKRMHYLDDGESQIVFRMSRVIEGLSGEREKFNSKALVLMFDSANKVVHLNPVKSVLHESQANEFNRNPELSLTDAQGNKIEFKIDFLPVGNGFMRDYSAELAHYNKINGIDTGEVVTAHVAADHAPVVKVVKVETGEVAPVSMIEYWLDQASSSESEQFMSWAFENRSTENLKPLEGTQAVNMLGYWYSQASTAERKKILAWLLSQ